MPEPTAADLLEQGDELHHATGSTAKAVHLNPDCTRLDRATGIRQIEHPAQLPLSHHLCRDCGPVETADPEPAKGLRQRSASGFSPDAADEFARTDGGETDE